MLAAVPPSKWCHHLLIHALSFYFAEIIVFLTYLYQYQPNIPWVLNMNYKAHYLTGLEMLILILRVDNL